MLMFHVLCCCPDAMYKHLSMLHVLGFVPVSYNVVGAKYRKVWAHFL